MPHNLESESLPLDVGGNGGSPSDQPPLPSSSATGSSRHPPAVDAQHRQPDEVQQDGEQLETSQQPAQPNSPAHAGRAPSNRTEGEETRSENDSTERERSGHKGSTVVELTRRVPRCFRPLVALYWNLVLSLALLAVPAAPMYASAKWASQPEAKMFKSLEKQFEQSQEMFKSLEKQIKQPQEMFTSLGKQFEQSQEMFKSLGKQFEQSQDLFKSLEKQIAQSQEIFKFQWEKKYFVEGKQPYCPVDYYVPYGPLVHPIHAGGNGANNQHPAYEGVVAGNFM